MSDTERKHAWLSPSTMSRILRCPGSAILSRDLPRKCSADAALGTLAHAIAEECLTRNLQPIFYFGEMREIDGHKVTVDDEMVEMVGLYMDVVRQYATLGELMVEVAVPVGHITHEPGAHGTADAIVIAGDELIIVDFKYGRGIEVSPERNEQLMTYALGALEIVSLLGLGYGVLLNETGGLTSSPGLAAIKKARLVIHQPRIRREPSEWVCSIDELNEFAEYAEERMLRIWRMIDDADLITFSPSFETCKFCPAKPCDAMTKHALEVTAADFDNLDAPPVIPNVVSSNLAALAAKVDFVEAWFEAWCKAVRGRVEAELLAGREVPGYKLVEGKRGARKWADPKSVEAELKRMRLKMEQMYDMSLISPTKAEKLFAGHPRRWAKLQNLITQSAGKLSIAPVTDKRPAIEPGEAVIAEFDVLPMTDN